MATVINVEELDIKDLKALTYDLLAQKQEIEKNLQIISKEIGMRNQKAEQKTTSVADVPVMDSAAKKPDETETPKT